MASWLRLRAPPGVRQRHPEPARVSRERIERYVGARLECGLEARVPVRRFGADRRLDAALRQRRPARLDQHVVVEMEEALSREAQQSNVQRARTGVFLGTPRLEKRANLRLELRQRRDELI